MTQADLMYELARQHQSELLREAEIDRLVTRPTNDSSTVRECLATVVTRVASMSGTQTRQRGPVHAQ